MGVLLQFSIEDTGSLAGPRVCVCVCVCVLVAQLCLTLCNPMDCSPPDSSIHGILQARIMDWVVSSFSEVSSQSRVQTCISCIDRWILYRWATREEATYYPGGIRCCVRLGQHGGSGGLRRALSGGHENRKWDHTPRAFGTVRAHTDDAARVNAAGMLWATAHRVQSQTWLSD